MAKQIYSKNLAIITNDKGLKKALKRVNELAKNARVAIGVRGADAKAKKTKRGKDGNVETDTKFNLVDVASVHEYGSKDGNIPERSFIRSTMERKKQDHTTMMQKLAIEILNPRSDMSVEKALALAGEKVRLDIQETIRKNTGMKPLSPKTIAAKGSSVALVDTAQLINGISYEVRMNNG